MTTYLGTSVNNEKVLIDFEGIQHLTVIGRTGCGKTESLHRIIEEFASHCSPEQIGIVLIDPKRDEFAIWKDLPHLIEPIAKGKEDCINSIENVYAIMQNRQSMRERIDKHIFVFIDELADLALGSGMQNSIDIINEILKRGAMVNIHLIAAAQSPRWVFEAGKIDYEAFTDRLVGCMWNKKDSKRFLGNYDAVDLKDGHMFFVSADQKTPVFILRAKVFSKK